MERVEGVWEVESRRWRLNLPRTVELMVRSLRNQVTNMVTRAIVKVVDDSQKFQALQVDLGNDEVRGDVEHVQPYGFTSVPLKGAEAVTVAVGGRRDHLVAIMVGDRRYRLRNLESGEVAVYTDEGDQMVFKRGGTIEVTASTKVKLITPLVEATQDFKIDGKLHVVGDTTLDAKLHAVGDSTFDGDAAVGGELDVTGNIAGADTITATTDVVGGGKSLKDHTHSVPASGLISAAAGSAVTGTATTDAPS